MAASPARLARITDWCDDTSLLTCGSFAYHWGIRDQSRWRKYMTRIGRLSSIVVSFCLAASAASEQDAEKAFFAGKTVRMVVGSATGGGYDVYARLITPYLSRALGATVIVENQPGAGGLISLNRLYVTEPDGLTLS